MEKPLRACLRALQRLMIETRRGPLRFIWAAGYRLVLGAAVALVRFVSPGAAVFVRGGLARGDVAFGLSDIDLVIAVDEGRDVELRRRLHRLYGRLPLIKDIVEAAVYSRAACRRTVSRPFLAWPAGPREHLLRAAPVPTAGGSLAGPGRCWRLLAGKDPLEGIGEGRRDEGSLWVWMELQFLWKHMFRNCAEPDRPHVGRNQVKSLRCVAAFLLWLEHGEPLHSNGLLGRFVEAYPEEREVVERLVDPRRGTAATPDAVGLLVRACLRIATRIESEGRRAGAVRLGLLGDGPTDRWPLLDWRARTLPGPAEESFCIVDGDIADPEAIALAARSETGESPYPALFGQGLLLLPSARRAVKPLGPTDFRAVHCAATDPVSFALLAGRRVALCPELPGWSIRHAAERARAEFSDWLDRDPACHAGVRLDRLFSAARAALLWESLADGKPELAVTPTSVARTMGGRTTSTALELYEAWKSGGVEPPAAAVSAFAVELRARRAFVSARAEAA